MKTNKIFFVAICGVLALASCDQEKEVVVESQLETVSYMLGREISRNVLAMGMDSLSMDAYSKGLEDGMNGEESLFADEETDQVLQAHFDELEKIKILAIKQNGEAFLANNAIIDGVVTLPSGLQYEILVPGTGATPLATDIVETHYRGMLLDGKVFDSSIERGVPAKFGVGGVIPAWVEALQLMKVGAKWRLYCPSRLAYGERGSGRAIGPFETLIFEIELISIVKE